jgi:hypothetical protein
MVMMASVEAAVDIMDDGACFLSSWLGDARLAP